MKERRAERSERGEEEEGEGEEIPLESCNEEEEKHWDTVLRALSKLAISSFKIICIYIIDIVISEEKGRGKEGEEGSEKDIYADI